MIGSSSFLGRSFRERAIDLLFLLPLLLILAGFLLYPLIYGVVLSLHDTQGFDLTRFVGLENYARAILGDAVLASRRSASCGPQTKREDRYGDDQGGEVGSAGLQSAAR